MKKLLESVVMDAMKSSAANMDATQPRRRPNKFPQNARYARIHFAWLASMTSINKHSTAISGKDYFL